MRGFILGTIVSVVALGACGGVSTGQQQGQPATCAVEPWDGDPLLGCSRDTTHSLLVCNTAPAFKIETLTDESDGGFVDCVQGAYPTVFCCP